MLYKTLFIIVIALMIVVISLLALWITLNKKQYNSFRKYAKEGDPCYYYIGEEKHKGVIMYYNPDEYYAEVKSETHIIKKVFSDSLYPILSYNYKKHKRCK